VFLGLRPCTASNEPGGRVVRAAQQGHLQEGHAHFGRHGVERGDEVEPAQELRHQHLVTGP